MEFLPVLEPLDKPKQGIWYSLIPRGSAPGVSVGHTCTFTASGGGKGRILIVGGANPSGSFSHSHIINLDNHEWDIPEWEGLEARYEHCSFVPESCPKSLWVFGGAQHSGNRSCIQNIQLTDSGQSLWKDVSVNGKPPGPRTYHTNSACLGDKLYVFSGGEAGAEPVSDQKLHVFDTVSLTWSQPQTHGRHPPARHGHIIVTVGSRVYIHGGMAGDKFHNDMYSLDTGSMKWEKVQAKGDIPSGVAAHSAVVLGKNIYIFGGMTAEGASNSMYRFNTDKKRWVLIKFEGDMPPNRLDHSMCLLPWKVHEENSTASSETVQLAFVYGGMDTQGVLYNDCIVTVVM